MDQMNTSDGVVWNGVSYKMLLSAQQTGGTLSVYESADFPGYGPPRHIHHREDETFVILSGAVEFLVGGKRSQHGPGDVVFCPRDVEHTFRILGTVPARMITVATPGGFESFFRDMATGTYKIPQDMATITRIAAGYEIEFTGPPLSQE